MTLVNGGGYSQECKGVYLTGGNAAGANYSGVTVENSSVSGNRSCIGETNTGGQPASYVNNTCTNGCTIH